MLLCVFRFKIQNKQFYNCEHEVLKIMIDTNLNFFSHLKQLCKKVANKLNALTRIILYLDKKTYESSLYFFFKGTTKLLPPNLDRAVLGVKTILSMNCKKEHQKWFIMTMILVSRNFLERQMKIPYI